MTMSYMTAGNPTLCKFV